MPAIAMAKRRLVPAREERLQNLLTNHSMIFMGMFEEALTALADRMADAPSGSKRSGTSASKKDKDEVAPEVRAMISDVFSGIREEASSELTRDPHAFKRYVSGPAFDKGLEIMEKYDFGRPMLTESLSDDVLASYVFLLLSGDKDIGRMFKEVSEWKAGLPEPPWEG
jgi:hypothetical protein